MMLNYVYNNTLYYIMYFIFNFDIFVNNIFIYFIIFFIILLSRIFLMPPMLNIKDTYQGNK